MKKSIFLSIFILLLQFVMTTPLTLTKAQQKQAYYAKIENDQTYFYSDPIDQDSSKLFILPQSYFVYLTDNANEEFYVAQYKELYGYVKKIDVTVMNGSPNTPYASASFTIADPEGLALYANPSFTNSMQLARLEYLSIVSTYYGTMSGENIPDLDNVWYYCRINQDQTDVFGYVYSYFCYKQSQIPTNTETFDIISQPVFELETTSTQPLSEIAMAFIVIGVSLPCLLIIYLLIKPSLQKGKFTKKRKPKKQHGDYFEFDENDLN